MDNGMLHSKISVVQNGLQPDIAGMVHCRAAQNKTFQSTFVAEEPKERKKARLSWYHPDDTVGLYCVAPLAWPTLLQMTDAAVQSESKLLRHLSCFTATLLHSTCCRALG